MEVDTVHGTKELWEIGEHAYFEYHCYRGHDSSDAEAWYRDHQRVEIIGVPDSDGKSLQQKGVTAAERADDGMPMVYRVRFSDGHEHDAFEDELFVSPTFFSLELGPPPASEIAEARAADAPNTGM